MIPDPIPPEDERDPNQARFWTPEWLAGEREADSQAANDEGTLYTSGEEFLDSLT